jgi:endoglucanase
LIQNPDLINLSSIQVLDYLIQKAADRCIIIILDYHVFNGGDSISELWYNDIYPETTVITIWQSLALRYITQWNVIGFDLKNENHGSASWGDNNLSTDWKLASERIGNAILSVNPKLLIFVEGIQDNSFPITTVGNQWGGGLSSALINPVNLSIYIYMAQML